MKYLFLFFFCFNAFAFDDTKWLAYNNENYRYFETKKLPKLEAFAKNYLDEFLPKDYSVFYPFGGPDVIYPMVLLSGAKNYLLIGLEVRGSKLQNDVPHDINMQIDSLIKRSFFITANMGKSISGETGVLPLMLAQIYLLKGKVLEVNFIDHAFGSSLEIKFEHNNMSKKITYVRANLDNDHITQAILDYINVHMVDVCMLKSSSYSLHKAQFSTLKDFIIQNAKIILQDDAGIPMNQLLKNYNLYLFGNYNKPYGVEWAGYMQPDLKNKYAEGSAKTKIDFCFGYGCGKVEPSIGLYIRKPLSE